MRKTTVLILSVVLLVVATSAQAQEDAERDTSRIRPEVGLTKVDEILKTIGLPGAAERARESGVPAEDIRIILDEADKRRLPPAETEVILRECGAAANENGPVDNFGAFVRSRLDAGLRGQDLAAAIHEEHRLRGKGKGKGHGQGGEKGEGRSQAQDRAGDEHRNRDEGVEVEGDDHDDVDDGARKDQRKNKGGKGR